MLRVYISRDLRHMMKSVRFDMELSQESIALTRIQPFLTPNFVDFAAKPRNKAPDRKV